MSLKPKPFQLSPFPQPQQINLPPDQGIVVVNLSIITWESIFEALLNKLKRKEITESQYFSALEKLKKLIEKYESVELEA
jgi:mannitol/fructose-specific phosphotransferase system IIA component (Ntr-type)